MWPDEQPLDLLEDSEELGEAVDEELGVNVGLQEVFDQLNQVHEDMHTEWLDSCGQLQHLADAMADDGE